MSIKNIRIDKSVEVKAIGEASGRGELWMTDDGPGISIEGDKNVLKLTVVMVVEL